MKTNRKALLTSIVSLVICVTMLIGTTFAWFTDTASTKVSKIQAGTLDVELYVANVKNGKAEELHNVEDDEWKEIPVFGGDILWEPGYTAYRVVKIKNAGNLAFQFALDVLRTADTVATNLPNVIDVYYTVVNAVPETFGRNDYKNWGEPTSLADVLKGDNDGVVWGRLLPANSTATPNAEDLESKGEITVLLALHMQESAGNEYMDKTEKFDIKLYAKQWTEEFDSESDQYDANAEYDSTRKPVEEECDHQNKTYTYEPVDGEAKHKVICECGETVRTVDCEYTHDCKFVPGLETGDCHLNYCVCGNFELAACDYTYNHIEGTTTHTKTCTKCNNSATENCVPSTGDCAKCKNHVHDYGEWTKFEETNTHTRTCTNNDNTETGNCVDTDGDRKCDTCDGNITIAPATVTITGTVNTPALNATYELKNGDNNTVATATAVDGTVTFTVDNLTETTTYTVVPTAADVEFTVTTNPTVAVTVEYDNENFEYTATADSFEYVSGYTLTAYNNENGYDLGPNWDAPWGFFTYGNPGAYGRFDNIGKVTFSDLFNYAKMDNVKFRITYTHDNEDVGMSDAQFNAFNNRKMLNDSDEPSFNTDGKYNTEENDITFTHESTVKVGGNDNTYKTTSYVFLDEVLKEYAKYPVDSQGSVDWSVTPGNEPDTNSLSYDTNYERVTNFTVQLWSDNFELYKIEIIVPTPSN